MSRESVVTILHFNDCYNVEPQTHEPIGGAARFCTALKSLASYNPLVLFSGDILAPSIMSTFTKGEQMIPVLNAFGVHCSVYGNHDFDFGLDNLLDFARRTETPWLMSNVIDNETNKPLADGLITYCLQSGGKKIGLVGLVEEEWLATLATIDQEDVTYLDFVSEGRKLARQLREKEKVDYVIALTHMRTPNDSRLAENVDEIDLILGGHDHDYEVKKVNGKYIVKSGTDFREFSKISLTFNDSKVDVTIERVPVTSKYPEDPNLAEALAKYSDVVEGKMDDVLGHFSTDLDGRFSSIRTRETNLGNFICDIMLAATHSDLAILNSGTLRSDRIHPKGPFKLRDLVTILPMLDHLIVINATGQQIWKALENGVSQYPKLEGRFPQVAGVTFAFDPTKEPGQRIDPKYIKIGDEFLDLEQSYRLVTKGYLHQGRDGYDILKECQALMTEEDSPELCTAIQNHFQAIKILTGNSNKKTRHRQSLVCVSRRHSIVKMFEDSSVQKAPLRRGVSLDANARRNLFHVLHQPSLDEVEHEQCKLEPKVEGRIQIFNDIVKARLEEDREQNFHPLFEEVIEEDEEISECFDQS